MKTIEEVLEWIKERIEQEGYNADKCIKSGGQNTCMFGMITGALQTLADLEDFIEGKE